MVRRSVAVLVGMCAIMTTGESLWAQREEDPRQALRSRFERSGLREGVAFPDVQIYDGEGNPFRTGALKGGHTVLVTGCLT